MKYSRLLLITSEFPPNVGGIGNHAYSLATALSSEGYKVTVQADVLGVDENKLQLFSLQQSFKINWIKRQKNLFATYGQRISNALKTSAEADVIICSGKFSLWIGFLIRLFRSDKKLVAVVHGSELDLKSRLAKKITTVSLCRFNKIISVSNYTQSYLPENLPERIGTYVIPNGISSEEFSTPKITKLSGVPALITIGSVTERKGQLNVINALPQILSKFPEAEYHIVGKPVLKGVLDVQIQNLQLNNKVHFYGAVSRQNLIKLLAGAKIKLMLSSHTAKGDFEGFGIAVLEANALGIPVIGSKDSGIADAIEHLKTGILVDAKNPKEVAEAVEKILADYDFYSANAITWASKHDWKNIVQQYKEAIETD